MNSNRTMNAIDSPLTNSQLSFLQKLEAISKWRPEDEEEVDIVPHDSLYDPFTSLEEFENWFDNSQVSLECEERLKYEKLIGYSEECKAMIKAVDEILGNLDLLTKQFEYSSHKTNSLHDTCENILQQQHALIIATDAIDDKLKYFKEMELMSKKFSSSSALILNQSLTATLKRLDECITFLQNKPNYLESATYLRNFKHLQSQALLTIRNHVVSSIERTAKQVIPGSTDTLAPGDSVFTLFYGRFQTIAPRVKSLMVMIEERKDNDELYMKYLRECQEAFFKARETLISPVLNVAINDMVSSHKQSYCSLTRNSTKMLMHICRDEHQLFFQFFTENSELLNTFLERLCVNLYDVLRSVVIHIEHLEILSELCVMLKQEIIDDIVDSDSSEFQAFGKIMSQLLEDTQERLVYRTNVYLQANIIGYSPAPGDLAYPEKLEMMESIAECLSSNTLSRSGSVSSVSDVSLIILDRHDLNIKQATSSPADVHGMWYPTVRRAIMCLTKLYRSLDNEAFQGLAQEVISGCLESLEFAMSQISINKSPTDGCLFFIKHLLVIREQISPFRIECSFREVCLDFTRVKNAALNILQNREQIFSLTNNNSLLKFLFEVPGAPQVIDQVVDSQRIVDNKIKISCEHFIAMTTNTLLNPLLKFVSLVDSVKKADNIHGQSLCTSESNSKLLNEVKDSFDEKLQQCRRTMSLYLANADTERILFVKLLRDTEFSVHEKLEACRKTIALYLSNADNERTLFLQLVVDLENYFKEKLNTDTKY